MAITFTSCGIMFNGTKQKVTVSSDPPGAEIHVNGLYTGEVTPAEIKVKRRVKDSPTSVKKKMTYTLKKEGYKDYTHVDESKFSTGTYLANVLNYGAGFIWDPIFGVNRKYPKNVNVRLSSTSVTTNDEITVEKTTINENSTVNNTPINKVEKPKTKETKTVIPENLFKPIVLVDEDFSDNSFGWLEKTEKKSTYKVQDNLYYMKDNTFTLKSPRHHIEGFNCKDDNYILEASFQFLDKKSYKMVGLGLAFSPDSSIHYVFNLVVEDNKKRVVITPFLGVSLKTMYQDALYDQPIEFNDDENVLKIVKQDDVTSFYLNDALLTSSPGFVFNSSLIKFNSGMLNTTSVNWIKITKTGVSKVVVNNENKRDIAHKKIQESGIATYTLVENSSIKESVVNSETKSKIKNVVENALAKDLKYRRSSLHSMMIYDPLIDYHETIKNTFGNLEMPTKFNDHNVGPYYILSISNIKQQQDQITYFLNQNDIAKQLISKWFNRNSNGAYNMDLIAERGLYDATAMDKIIASNLQRGNALLADAGEELINKTFVIVHDLKFINKEEGASILSKALLDVAKENSRDGDLLGSAMTGALGAGVKIAGKGYMIKTTSYLYRLVWDEETAAIFYQDYWTDSNSHSSEKVEAFNKSNNFKLSFVGSQSAMADVQSSIFTNKTNEELIEMATVKAIDKAIAKLERKYEEFRTKTPLYSVEPIAAKIGVKEGLEKGDKFEVLEQQITEEGNTIYKRVGVISVDKVWDNSFSDEEMEQLKKEGKLPEQEYTTFKGSGKYYPGQLIKQIN